MGTLYVMQGGAFVEQGGGSGGGTGTGHHNLSNTTTSASFVTVAADASTHTKGGWVEAIASTSTAAETITITLMTPANSAASNSATLLDVAVGASSSEVVVIANIPVGFAGGGMSWTFPLAVASGSRIALRTQSAVSAKSLDIGVSLRAAGTSSTAGTTCTAHGADTATSSGTNPATPGAINTEAATWTQLVASTAADYSKLVVAVTASANSNIQAAQGLIDIGIGASSSESAVITDIGYVVTSSEQIFVNGTSRHYEVSIPSGSRISFRHRANSTNTTTKPHVVVYGLD